MPKPSSEEKETKFIGFSSQMVFGPLIAQLSKKRLSDSSKTFFVATNTITTTLP